MNQKNMKNLPEAFLRSMQELLQDEYQDYLDSYGEERVYGLRVNTLKTSPEEFLKISPFSLEPVPWTDNGFYYSAKDKPGKHPYYFAGLYYLQEPSAMSPAAILPVSPGEKVLDICAAPGGKSTELSAKLQGQGLLVSNDISNSRAQALLKNLELFGVKNAVVMSEDPVRLSGRFEEYFDKILIDAPCSGEGMFRKEPAVIKSWIEHGNGFYVELQKKITEAALKMLKPGGMLLYSTCTFSVLEDENIVLHMKKLCPELEVVDISGFYEGFMPGRPDLAEAYDPELLGCARLYPHKIRGEGHFAALLKKGSGENETVKREASEAMPGKKDAGQNLSETTRAFLLELRLPISESCLELRGERLFLMPEDGKLPLSSLRILRAGLLLGEQKKGRFEPSQALAMALRGGEYPYVIDLPCSDGRVIRYLKGETLDLSGMENLRDGLYLVRTDGFSLGFGKVTGNSLKNKYLPGWRWQ